MEIIATNIFMVTPMTTANTTIAKNIRLWSWPKTSMNEPAGVNREWTKKRDQKQLHL